MSGIQDQVAGGGVGGVGGSHQWPGGMPEATAQVKRLYVCGPMTGMPELNFPAFHAAAKRLREAGFEVVNPAELNPDPGASWLACMRRDVQHLALCDGVATLDGWQNSRGARVEVGLAEGLGLPVASVWRWATDGCLAGLRAGVAGA